METELQPSLKIAKAVLPSSLLQAIEHVFAQNIKGCALVGGTALAGFYAGHRRSDDMDLFVDSTVNYQAAVLAVKSLAKKGAEFREASQSNQYFHAVCLFRKHTFSIDIVVDENLFKVGRFVTLSNHIVVADLPTILKMKAATLVSRCSEKDLFDLSWLLGTFPKLSISTLLEMGMTIDNGVNAENVLASLAGTSLRKEACNFSDKLSSAEVFKEIKTLQGRWVKDLQIHLQNLPSPPLAKLTKIARKLLK